MVRTVGSDDTEEDRIATTISIPKHELSPDLVAEVVTAYNSGQPIAAIAEAFDIHRATVHLHIRRAGVAPRGSIPRMDLALRATACDLYQQGLSLAKVSAKIGVPATTVKRALLANGVRLRGRTHPLGE